MENRPDGKRLMLAGKLAFFTGVIAWLLNSFSFMWRGVLDYHPVSEALTFLGVFGTLLGAVAWFVGYLVFALSFIPGKGD